MQSVTIKVGDVVRLKPGNRRSPYPNRKGIVRGLSKKRPWAYVQWEGRSTLEVEALQNFELVTEQHNVIAK